MSENTIAAEYKFQDIPNIWGKFLSSSQDELPDCVKDKILLALMERLGNNLIKNTFDRLLR